MGIPLHEQTSQQTDEMYITMFEKLHDHSQQTAMFCDCTWIKRAGHEVIGTNQLRRGNAIADYFPVLRLTKQLVVH